MARKGPSEIMKMEVKGKMETAIELRNEVYKLFAEGNRPNSDKVKALVPYVGTRNLYYQAWKRGEKPPGSMIPTERVKRLGFASTGERHKWIIEHQDELRTYYERYGKAATEKQYHIGSSTIQKLMTKEVKVLIPGESQEGTWLGKTNKEEVKLPDEASILDSFISMIERAISNYRNLKAENQQLKASNKKWQQMAGRLNQDIQSMIHSG